MALSETGNQVLDAPKMMVRICQTTWFTVIIAQMWAAATATGIFLRFSIAKSFGQTALRVAVFTTHFQVTGFTGGTMFNQA